MRDVLARRYLYLKVKMKTPLISVDNLVKEFKVARREPGLKGAVKYLFSRKHEIVKAVDNISFKIHAGEMVGYIGRNGAGKSTTIKMLTGILVPTSGIVRVDGVVPYKKRSENGKKIGVVFGQRTHLRWDIPVRESFRLLKAIYEVPQGMYDRNLELFTEVLELDGLLSKPARKLSLGQRMKCDLAASFLHDPKIVYLDEPTIGLDIIVKENVREFIKTLNREKGTTVILTTHDLRDIEDICKRAIIIDKGKIVYDGELREIKEMFGMYKVISFEVKERLSAASDFQIELSPGMELQQISGHSVKIRIDKQVISTSEATRYVMDTFNVVDMSIEEESIESVVKKIYQNQ